MNYLFFALRRQKLHLISSDSAVPGLNRNIAYMSRLLIPKEEVIKKFDIHMNVITTKIQKNNKQTMLLTNIRDSLLPRLMSGKIRGTD
jgi:type I restriction enzyme S subunit